MAGYILAAKWWLSVGFFIGLAVWPMVKAINSTWRGSSYRLRGHVLFVVWMLYCTGMWPAVIFRLNFHREKE